MSLPPISQLILRKILKIDKEDIGPETQRKKAQLQKMKQTAKVTSLVKQQKVPLFLDFYF